MGARLENDELIVVAKHRGAELCSIWSKRHRLHYLWDATPSVWARHAPVLFPIVGRLNNDTYRHNGQEYHLTQHGFARDMMFSVTDKSDAHVVYELAENAQTLEVYPFRFNLRVTYRLAGNRVSVAYTVMNPANGAMWFSLGAHPAFMTPIVPGGDWCSYQFEFNQPETAKRWLLDDGLYSRKTAPFFEGRQAIPLTADLFSSDALVFKELRSTRIGLTSTHGGPGLSVEFEGFPYLGLWAKSGRAPFVCIEPWCGLADPKGYDGEFKDREGVLCLEGGRRFERRFAMTFE